MIKPCTTIRIPSISQKTGEITEKNWEHLYMCSDIEPSGSQDRTQRCSGWRRVSTPRTRWGPGGPRASTPCTTRSRPPTWRCSRPWQGAGTSTQLTDSLRKSHNHIPLLRPCWLPPRLGDAQPLFGRENVEQENG